MTAYELIYFDVRALAEPIRWIFKLAKVPFVDTRLEGRDWGNLKKDFPLGQVPVLMEDGKMLIESYAIGRYLAKKFGYVANEPYLDYISEQASEVVEDCRLLCRALPFEIAGRNDPVKVKELKENLLTTVFPHHLQQLEKILRETNGPFIAGDKITYGDMVVASWMNVWESLVDENLLRNYPGIKKHLESVMDLLEIKNWIDCRPDSFV